MPACASAFRMCPNVYRPGLTFGQSGRAPGIWQHDQDWEHNWSAVRLALVLQSDCNYMAGLWWKLLVTLQGPAATWDHIHGVNIQSSFLIHPFCVSPTSKSHFSEVDYLTDITCPQHVHIPCDWTMNILRAVFWRAKIPVGTAARSH